MPFSSPGYLPDPDIESMSPALAGIPQLPGKPHFMYSSVSISIPISQFIPPILPSTPSNHKFVFCFCNSVCFVDKFPQRGTSELISTLFLWSQRLHFFTSLTMLSLISFLCNFFFKVSHSFLEAKFHKGMSVLYLIYF